MATRVKGLVEKLRARKTSLGVRRRMPETRKRVRPARINPVGTKAEEGETMGRKYAQYCIFSEIAQMSQTVDNMRKNFVKRITEMLNF